METVVVKGVEEGTNGWYEVEFEDGQKASTKDKRLADAAFASRGTEIEVELNSTKTGKYTNTYLNAIEGVEGAPRPAKNGAAPRGRSGGGRSSAEGERIARQWAYGRAVELLSMSATEFTMPLDDAARAAIVQEAEWLLSQTK